MTELYRFPIHAPSLLWGALVGWAAATAILATFIYAGRRLQR